MTLGHSPRTFPGEYAPIAIFAYRRPEHVNRLIDSLLQNAPFACSPVVVFCDGARDEHDQVAVAQTRAVIRERLGSRAEIIESNVNNGLARSIIAGVTQLCSLYGRVIVLEDDLVLHPGCLDFLNAALGHYADDSRVYHVNAYRYPVPTGSTPTFSRLPSSWGWATWQRAWGDFEPDASKLERLLRAQRLSRALDFGGTFPYYRMLKLQVLGKVDSWAIRWYASVLLRGGLALVPNAAQVNNRGFDNSGIHCGATSQYDVELGAASHDWPPTVVEDMLTYRQTQAFFRTVGGSFARRAARKLKHMLWTN
jgi:hypothetical protein